jgi:hypothetical protein
MLSADLKIDEVLDHTSLVCRSGHVASKLFCRDGPKSPEVPTKFFEVTSRSNPEVNGIYCEPCLIIANALNRLRKPP